MCSQSLFMKKFIAFHTPLAPEDITQMTQLELHGLRGCSSGQPAEGTMCVRWRGPSAPPEPQCFCRLPSVLCCLLPFSHPVAPMREGLQYSPWHSLEIRATHPINAGEGSHPALLAPERRSPREWSDSCNGITRCLLKS